MSKADSELPLENGGTNSIFRKRVLPSVPTSTERTSRISSVVLATLDWGISRD